MALTRIDQHLNRPVFYLSSLSILVLVLFALIAPQTADVFFTDLQNTIIENGSWFYVVTVAIILITVLYLGFSSFGDIRLGPDHCKPDYSLPSWLSMLFAAGMGIGLMFFGVAEPVMHFLSPPTATQGTTDAVREAMKMTFFHWGLHAWAIYAVVGLILAYFSFRLNLPLTLRSALYPMIGDRIYGWAGHTVDILAVVSTVFGIATSLGLGAAQINSGLNYLFGLEESIPVQIYLMIGIIAVAIVSVATGLDKGIRRLSELNMILAIALLLFILILGPTVFLLAAYVQNTGAYLSDIVRNTFNLFAYDKTDWIGGWTIFYWGWWLAWAPFVGLFIARISRGRTIREFVIGVLVIPTAFTLFWMTVFGNSAIDLIYTQGVDKLGDMVSTNAPVALFLFLENFPFQGFLSFIATLMVIVFFVTSCDSGAMVVDMLCSHGRNDTPVWQRIYWAVGVGVVSAILLTAGGLNALQTMTIATALPFAIILLISMVGLIKALRIENHKKASLTMNLHPHPSTTNSGWEQRLSSIIQFPNKITVTKFIDTTVRPALQEVSLELASNQVESEIVNESGMLSLNVQHGSEHSFVFGVKCEKYLQPSFSPDNEESLVSTDEHTYCRAEVHLAEGGQDYDIMGWSKQTIINDVIDQYHKHQHFLHVLR
ncbi:choline BCCT transporter BetT [Paraglaciecola sp. MB-3u-78]|uniref:BCCT family transporter n=1 Tax=Paraglaciecola sp. MB-3u-78 TaxID=2058332 RepID=UPI000C337E13|nr:choline BCCT transporter BetT [Paraglaciecola sp. MB-3u-78]PKG92937.1 choline transporter [Paraglaciecola sp. MB-3u-78]